MNEIQETSPPSLLRAMIEQMLDSNAFWADPVCPFQANLESIDGLEIAQQEAVNNSRILLVAGDNASGKSLLVEYFRSYSKYHHGTTSISISIRERTGSGLSDMAGMRRTMIFGDESEQSTGATSVSVLQAAFHNLDSWTQSGKKVVMVLDEPELGLSDAYAHAMGLLIAKRMSEINSPEANLVVVTHSKGLAQGLAQGLGYPVPFIHMNEKLAMSDWLERQSIKSVQELVDLKEAGSAGRLSVRSLEQKIAAEFKAEEDKKEGADSGKRLGNSGVRKQRKRISPGG